jgi:CRISPR system Cascade subunit CasA
MPKSQAELLTLQSRRLLLKREDDRVVGFLLLGGDFFERENAFAEQMTIWRNTAKKESDPPEYVPRRHDPSKQLWRDFSALVSPSSGERRPGVVAWLARLRQDKILPRDTFSFETASVKYGDKDFFVDDVFSDSLSFNADLLTELGDGWIYRIIAELENTEKWVWQLGILAADIAKAGGGDGKGDAEKARARAYFQMDIPFRDWLADINPETDDLDVRMNDWREKAQQIVRALGRELIAEAGIPAFIGRDVNGNYMNAPKAHSIFLAKTKIKMLGDG